jgi:transposase-like protein
VKLTLAEIRKRVETEGDAYALLEDLRWGGAGPVCPHCGHDKAYFLTPKNGTSRITGPKKTLSQRRVWKCAKCRKQFSVLTGTIFHGTKIPIEVWLMVMVQMCSAKNGVSAREIERMHDLTPQSAWFMLHRLREAMKREPLVGMLRGTIVADETWIGGTPANRHGAKALRQPAKGTPIVPGVPRPHTDKTTVLSLIDKATREVRSTVIPDVTGHTLRKVISEQVDMAGSHLETDESNNYRQLGQEFQSHETVNHAADEYVRNGVSTNRAEGVLFPAQAVNRRDGITTSPRSTCPGTWPNSISGIRPAKCGTRSGCRK